MSKEEHESNEAAYRRLKESINKSLPDGHFVAIAGGKIIGGFATLDKAFKATKNLPIDKLFVRASQLVPIPKRSYKPLKLTLKRLLRHAAKTGVISDANSCEIAELTERGSCDSQSRLTEWGKTEAVSLCSLKNQCALLGLPHEIWRIARAGRPELAVLNAMKSDARKIAFCEGGAIHILLYCLCFDRLFALGTECWGSAKAAASCMYAGIPYAPLLKRNPIPLP